MKNFFLIFGFLFFFATDAFSQGDLVVTPNRVVFEGRKQKEELNLINYGEKTATFSISFVQRRMNEDGSFTIITEPDADQLFADPFVRIYPRQVTLAPRESQVVMLQFRKQPDMIAGEYRSHLYFRSEKDYKPLGSEKKETAKLVSVELTPIFGISIPVIIKYGELKVNTTITDLQLENNKDQTNLKFVLNREGNASVYGDIRAEFISKDGKSSIIGRANGIAVYTNIAKRLVSLKLENSAGQSLKDGSIKVYYNSHGDKAEIELYAQAELKL